MKLSLLAIALVLGGCSFTGAVTPTETVSELIAPTSTIPAPLIILLNPAGSDPSIAGAAAEAASLYAQEHGMRFEERVALDPAQIPGELTKLIVLAPDPGALALATAAPHANVIAIDFTPDDELPNLVSLHSGVSQEAIAFIAGYMAALSAEDWRAGMIYTPQSAHLVDDFVSGVEYFCGLCIPAAPPNNDYPQAFQAADAQNWQGAADALLGQSIRVVYLAPELETSGAANYLASFGVLLIGSGAPPTEIGGNWIASIGMDPRTELRERLTAILAGRPVESSGSLALTNVNPGLLSEGRLAHVQALISDLLAGLISPGDLQ